MFVGSVKHVDGAFTQVAPVAGVRNRGQFTSAQRTDYRLTRYACYSKWQDFESAIERAKITATNSGASVTSHFVGSAKMVRRPQGGGMEQADYRLTRYACYLVAMNGDPRKPEIAGPSSTSGTQGSTRKPSQP